MIVPRVLYYPSIEQTAEIFRDLRYLPVIPQLRIDPRSPLPPFGMAVLCQQRPTRFDKHA